MRTYTPLSTIARQVLLALLFALLFGLAQPAHAAGTGIVVAWGRNDYGQSSVPDGLSGVTAITVGRIHSLVLKGDGTVVAWGNNDYGQRDVPSGLSNVTAIAAGYRHSLALKGDGTVVAWGNNDYGQTNVPSGLSNVTAIAAGYRHSLALKSDGTVVTWGCGNPFNYGQCSVPAGLSNVTAIGAGFVHSLALKSDGTVVAWGSNQDGAVSVPAGLSGVIAIAVGLYHNLALNGGGTVVAWGDNSEGQTSVPSGLSGITAIAAGGEHNLALVPAASDTTAPIITPSVAGTLGSNGWYVSDVTVSWSVADAESMIGSQTGCDTTTITSDTNSVTFICSATSAGGTNSQSITIKRDATAPSGVSATASRAPNANGWYNAPVGFSFSGTDATSGIANCTTTSYSGSDSASVSVSGSCIDQAGNVGPASISLKYDATAPTLAPNISPDPALLNGSATASANASDATSGIASQSCGAVSTSSIGAKSVSCGATDNAGNTANANASYNVIYNFSGFFSPVSNPPRLNQVSAGKSVALTFSLAGNQGLNILATNFPASRPIDCGTLAPLGSYQTTTSAVKNSLQYSAKTNQYTYSWKLDKAWIGTCRQFDLKLNDGSEHLANFKFTK
jgi:hypothetical protein